MAAGVAARPRAGGDRPTRPPAAGPDHRQGWASAGPRRPAGAGPGPGGGHGRPAAGRPPSGAAADGSGRGRGSCPSGGRIGRKGWRLGHRPAGPRRGGGSSRKGSAQLAGVGSGIGGQRRAPTLAPCCRPGAGPPRPLHSSKDRNRKPDQRPAAPVGEAERALITRPLYIKLCALLLTFSSRAAVNRSKMARRLLLDSFSNIGNKAYLFTLFA